MHPLWALVSVVAVVLAAGALALALRAGRGRRREGGGAVFRPGELPGLRESASRATLVQFSTEFCGTCPGTRRYLRRVAEERDGVRYLDVDLTADPRLATRLRILQTPTVFVLDADGRLVSRFGGAPRADELSAVLDELSSAERRR